MQLAGNAIGFYFALQSNWCSRLMRDTFGETNKQTMFTALPSNRINQVKINCAGALLVLFSFVAPHIQAQMAQQPTPGHVNCWTSFGQGLSTVTPGKDPFYGNSFFFEAEASLNVEYKQIVYTIRGYGMANVSDNLFSNTGSSLSCMELMIGKRFYGTGGSVILSAGISKGQLDMTTADTGTQTGGWFFSSEIYSHYTSDFIGLPLSVRYLSGGKHTGIELGAYCHIHKYSDVGLSLCLSLGKRK
jgi:hypothetical protein